MKISVIIPVFNAAATLQSSLDSILKQSWENIEICAVNDASTDSSLAILEEFKNKFERNPKRQIKIISQNSNRGVAEARNTALDAITGDLICWVDADDTINPAAIEKAAMRIQDDNADIVGWDWTLSSPNGDRYMRQPDCQTIEEALKALMGGTLRWNLWLFMAKKEIFNDIRFNPGMNMGEDMMAILKSFLKAKAFSQIHESFYTYRQTESSLSKRMSEENLSQVCHNLDVAEEALLKSEFAHLAEPYISLLKLNVKLPLLVSVDKNEYIRWINCYPEANAAIMQNNHLPLRTKLLQWMASRKMWCAVKLYNRLVFGLIYKLMLCGRYSQES